MAGRPYRDRIGVYGLAVALKTMVEMDMTVEEVDALTGPAIGRAKSATFRTADIAGIDVVNKVAAHIRASVPGDPERDVFELPPFVAAMYEKKWLGEAVQRVHLHTRGTLTDLEARPYRWVFVIEGKLFSLDLELNRAV